MQQTEKGKIKRREATDIDALRLAREMMIKPSWRQPSNAYLSLTVQN